MPAAGTKDSKDSRRTKLSLRKKAQKDGQGACSRVSTGVLPGPMDLNETCEFREPVSFGGAVAQSKQLRGKAANPGKKPDRCSETSGDSKRQSGSGKDEVVSMATTEVETEEVQCQVCSKSLTHMNSQRRQQHVNRCIDKAVEQEQADRELQALLERARTAVLDCPMCGKGFKTDTVRLSHLKKCSQTLGVATETLLKLTKDQETERQTLLAKGVLPDSVRNLKVKTAAQSRKRKTKEPKSKYEEDVQVAMAISTSIAEQEKLHKQDLLGKLPDSSTSSMGQGNKRGKKKAVYEDVCLLTTLTEADKQRRLEEKVNNVLLHEGWRTSHFQDKIKLLESELHLESARKRSRALWDQSLLTPDEGSTQMFYVDTLIPPLVVTTSAAGSKARKKTKIPGREVTFMEEKMDIVEKRDRKYSEGDEIITASTQTAVVLAELAMDDTSIQGSLENLNTSLLSDTQHSGYCVQTLYLKEEDQQQEQAQVLLDYKSLVNSPDCSDISIVTADGQTLHAHAVILSVRCPQLLKMAEKSVVRLDATVDVTMSLLSYIYTGELTLAASRTDLEILANKLELPGLETLCKNLVPSNETSDSTCISEKDTEVCDVKEEFVESKLDLKQIWGESDSDSDLEEGKQTERESDTGDNVNTELEDEDYHDIMCTQRRLARASKSEDMKEKAKSIDSDNSDDNELLVDNAVDEDKSVENFTVELADSKKRNDDKNFERTTSVKDDKVVKMENKSKDVTGEGNLMEAYEAVSSSVDSHKRVMSAGLCDDSIVVSSDEETVPSPKRARLCDSQDMEVDSAEQDTDVIDDDVKIFENISGANSSNLDKDEIHEGRTSIDTRSEVSLNKSGADLFSSPTPVKGIHSFNSETGVIVTKAADSVTSTEKNTTSDEKTVKRKLDVVSPIPGNTIDNSIILDDSDSDRSESGEKETENMSVCKLSNRSVEVTPVKEMIDEKVPCVAVCDKSRGSQNSSKASCFDEDDSNSAKMYDDDLEITGDNFDVLTKGSPVFNDKKSYKTKKVSTRYGDNREIENVDKLSTDDNIVQCFEDSFNDDDIEELKDESVYGSEEAIKSAEVDEMDKIEQDTSSDDVKEMVVEIGSEESFLDKSDEEVNTVEGREEDITSSSDTKITEESITLDDDDGVRQPTDDNNAFSVVDDKVTEESDYGEEKTEHIPGSSEADVWEGFDDDGMGYVPPVESPDAGPSMDKPDEGGVENMSFQDGEDSFVFQLDTEDASTDLQPSTTGTTNEVFVTPTVKETRKAKKTNPWMPPSPFTPMPQYDKMATPDIKKAVQNYGVKPVGKKRMIKVLQDIYHQTHQYETDSECEEIEGTESLAASTCKAGDDDGDSGDNGEPSFSQEDRSSQDSDASGGCDVFEESCLHMMSSDSDASPQKSVDVNRQIFAYMRKNLALHKRVLMYEPLELDVLKRDLKEAKVKCSMDKLMDFLDERCIAFTTKNSRNSRRGRQKKGSPKKAGAKSPRKPGRPKSSKSIASSQS